MENRYYPVALRSDNYSGIVIGGGIVAYRKVKGLIESGFKVKVISPALQPDLKKLYAKKKIKWLKRCVKKEDLCKALLVISATDKPEINKKVSFWAKRGSVLVNVVDNSSLSSFISPAIFRTNKAIIAVHTDGKDPVLSRDIKNFLKEHWNEFLSYRNQL